MSVLTYVRVEGFRSIRDAEMVDLDSYNPVIGLNSTGKSNWLRALNLFFNDDLDEEHQSLDLARDFTSFAPKRTKKRVAVTVGLNLRGEFHVRGQADFHANHNISGEIFIRRTWVLGTQTLLLEDTVEFGSSLDSMLVAGPDELPAVMTHIRAIRFVYVPNHTRPADLIRSQLAPLRSTLVARLRSTPAYKTSQVGDLLTELSRMGDRMFGNVSEAMRRGLPGMSVAADLPLDFADLVFTVGVQAIADGQDARPPELEGSGAQSFMLLHVLDLADRTHRSGAFGWIQASIWALEEPESFLHAGLRAQFSIDLARYAEDGRRQVFITSHQDEFVRVASHVWIAERNPDTGFKRCSARDALLESARRSITSFSHPLFAYPTEPVVVVEGKFDEIYLRSAIQESDLRPRWRLLSPSAAFGENVGGDSVLEYLKYNQQVLASRPDSAPVIVLRDWETTDREKYNRQLAIHPYSRCLVAPADLSNPELDETFAGIERFAPTSLIEGVIPHNKLMRDNAEATPRYSVKRKTFAEHKDKLAQAIEDGAPAGPHLAALLAWLDHEVVGILAEVPAGAFA